MTTSREDVRDTGVLTRVLEVEFGRWRGHRIDVVDGVGVYRDTGDPVVDDPDRACGYCGKHRTPEGYDGCIGKIEGAMNACCGHGPNGFEGPYVQLQDGRVFHGTDAEDLIADAQRLRQEEGLSMIAAGRDLEDDLVWSEIATEWAKMRRLKLSPNDHSSLAHMLMDVYLRGKASKKEDR